MTRSYRTDKEPRVASRRVRRNDDGTPVLPRVVERRPAPGDTHPLPSRFVRRVLERVPLEYTYALTAIELRARPGKVGEPFGLYRPDERSIVLYSLPDEWHVSALSRSLRESIRRFHGTVEESQGTITVKWASSEIRALWFYSYVFAHELGHHKRFYYRRRNGARGRLSDEETVADLHARRLTDQLMKAFRAARRSRAGK